MGVRMNRTFKYIAKFPSDKIFNDPFVSFDIETTGLNPRKDTIVGASFCVGNGVGYYTPDWRGLAEAIARSNSQVICHNAVFDYSFIKQQGIEFKQRIHDTMLLADCLDPDRESKGLKDLSVALISLCLSFTTDTIFNNS
jgi:DNA polymerase I-like protein with 3'-5' exonuclease and polymerase domains